MRISKSRLAGIKKKKLFCHAQMYEGQILGHSKQKSEISKIHFISERNKAGWVKLFEDLNSHLGLFAFFGLTNSKTS